MLIQSPLSLIILKSTLLSDNQVRNPKMGTLLASKMLGGSYIVTCLKNKLLNALKPRTYWTTEKNVQGSSLDIVLSLRILKLWNKRRLSDYSWNPIGKDSWVSKATKWQTWSSLVSGDLNYVQKDLFLTGKFQRAHLITLGLKFLIDKLSDLGQTTTKILSALQKQTRVMTMYSSRWALD